MNGLEIPTVSYSDQPYIVKTDDDAWLCCVTTGSGAEGAPGQHIITLRSNDQGQSWSKAVPVEPPNGTEASYAVMLKTSFGRIYIFYNHNTDNIREVRCHNGKDSFSRVDSLGHFVFKYSDDHGRSWSEKRYNIPIRKFKCDNENIYNGRLLFFWNVGKPFIHDNAAYVSLHKVGQMGKGFFQQSEGALLKSDNILIESDPENINWETLPDGDIGLRTPPGGGPVAEEQSYVVLSDGSFYVNYRSIDGYPVEAYSRDGGHTWSKPQYKCYSDGRRMKHPRAANFIWKCLNGKYLYWFHNHGGHFISSMLDDDAPYNDRNPVWLCGGVEADSPEGKIIKWSQPEIVLYDDDPFIRMSYPDLIEENGKYYLTETQKNIARVHEIPLEFIDRIWTELEIRLGITRALISIPEKIELNAKGISEIKVPSLPEFFIRDHLCSDFRGLATRKGFSLEMTLLLSGSDWHDGTVIEGRRSDGRGLALRIVNGSLELVMNDGWMEQNLKSEPCLKPGVSQHVVVNIDGGPRIVSFIVNGHFCDGGEYRQFGWQRFSPYLQHINWTTTWKLGHTLNGKFKLHDRILMTAEAVAAYYADNLSNDI